MSREERREKILIFDVLGIPSDTQRKFQGFGLIVVDAKNLSRKLCRWDKWKHFNPQPTLLVFPGNGANIVRGYLPDEWLNQWQWASVYTKRYWTPGEDPRVVAQRVFPDRMVLNIKDIIVVDDVVSSGITCRLLRKINYPWIPNAKWHAVSWITQRAKSLRGFTSTHSVERYGTRGNKVPINSLSTLLRDQEIAASFARRNFPDSQEKLLELLRETREIN